MEIGNQIKNLRIQKNLTQEELAERTNLSKGYISQVERDLSVPSMEVFFDILEVLGCSPRDFFDEKQEEQRVVYTKDEMTVYEDDEKGYEIKWLVPGSNENEMEPVFLKLTEKGQFKEFSPSLAETFGFVLEGEICIEIGLKRYFAKKGESIYFHATQKHQIINHGNEASLLLLVVTDSYL
ncbi:XRE family transcriptional regulator [Carnobacterium sp. ISL-102]|uniref:helix-turn-helix domain-containing protein n=1 Tax=Carnobacterium sp. ISL-102 TaxID=2819142 RepID=UPI001BE5A6ED|nr:XRE family transcriptional regulator [Carnobacterium sp. ISL-102]MBT2733122.1 helix-turn-helix transcriptional regulator [Carnobacterium sp. ISL-102]